MAILIASAGAPVFADDPAEKMFELDIVDDRLADSDRPLRVGEGDRVTLIWTTDRTADIHLHGYNVKAAVEPGQATEMSLTANATGRFPITTHGSDGAHLTLQYLEVHPR
ncbi:MAG: hypothetical protein GY791_17205 [Alphaproteobacteria bacterium]|nr:hypothetical protein [Alphaproteobacteria bacterium]